MPAYKYTLKSGKTLWYANFYYTDWTGEKKHICKRGFKTQREAKDYERSFLDQQSSSSDILFSSLVANYLEDMEHRLKPTTMENKRFIIDTKLLPYFGKQKICDIDTIKVRKWQNELISYRDDDGKPFSQTYLKTVNNQLSAIMNYAVSHYRLPVNPCRAAGSMGKSKADEMNIWTQAEYEKFSNAISKSSMKLAFDILFYTGMRSGELLALTPADILSSKRIDINKNYAKIKGEELFLEPKTPKAKRCIWYRKWRQDILLPEDSSGKRNEKSIRKNWSEANQSTRPAALSRKYADRAWGYPIRDCRTSRSRINKDYFGHLLTSLSR